MNQMIAMLCTKLVQHKIIMEDDREVYEYCISVFLLNTCYYLICLLVMLYYKCFLLPTIFTVCFLLLRSYMGGWHAKNMGGCLLFGLLLFTLVVNIFIYLDIAEQEKMLFSGFSVLFAGWGVRFLGVQDHPNRRLKTEQKLAAKRKCYKILVMICLLMLCTSIFQRTDIAFSMALACLVSTLLLLLAKFQQKGREEYETHETIL